MKIRMAAAEDLESIVHLFGQLGYSTEPEKVEKQLQALRCGASGQALVSEERGSTVGVAIVHIMKPLHVEGSWALLSALVVDDKCRSSGVGAQLLAAAEQFAVQHDCSHLELSSSTARTRAHIFYERNGYKEQRMRFVKYLL